MICNVDFYGWVDVLFMVLITKYDSGLKVINSLYHYLITIITTGMTLTQDPMCSVPHKKNIGDLCPIQLRKSARLRGDATLP